MVGGHRARAARAAVGKRVGADGPGGLLASGCVGVLAGAEGGADGLEELDYVVVGKALCGVEREVLTDVRAATFRLLFRERSDSQRQGQRAARL